MKKDMVTFYFEATRHIESNYKNKIKFTSPFNKTYSFFDSVLMAFLNKFNFVLKSHPTPTL